MVRANDPRHSIDVAPNVIKEPIFKPQSTDQCSVEEAQGPPGEKVRRSWIPEGNSSRLGRGVAARGTWKRPRRETSPDDPMRHEGQDEDFRELAAGFKLTWGFAQPAPNPSGDRKLRGIADELPPMPVANAVGLRWPERSSRHRIPASAQHPEDRAR